eukprot:SAG31_NODE_86_length_26973_cov_16.850897_11_plen_144_part_00
MGNESSTMQGTTEKTSVIDDIGSWWDALNLEEWAKGVLDDIEQAVTGSKTLSKVCIFTFFAGFICRRFRACCSFPLLQDLLESTTICIFYRACFAGVFSVLLLLHLFFLLTIGRLCRFTFVRCALAQVPQVFVSNDLPLLLRM